MKALKMRSGFVPLRSRLKFLAVSAAILTLAGCTNSAIHSATRQPSQDSRGVSTVAAGTKVTIRGEDRLSAAMTFAVPVEMIIAGASGYPNYYDAGTISQQKDFVSAHEPTLIEIGSGLIRPGGTKMSFSAKRAGFVGLPNLYFGNYNDAFTTPLVPANLGGAPAIALACPGTGGGGRTSRLILISTAVGLVWIEVSANDVDESFVHQFIASIRVPQPGPATGWYNPAPARKKPVKGRQACVSDATTATLGVATP